MEAPAALFGDVAFRQKTTMLFKSLDRNGSGVIEVVGQSVQL